VEAESEREREVKIENADGRGRTMCHGTGGEARKGEESLCRYVSVSYIVGHRHMTKPPPVVPDTESLAAHVCVCVCWLFIFKDTEPSPLQVTVREPCQP
jgi:hypothetical protein